MVQGKSLINNTLIFIILIYLMKKMETKLKESTDIN